MRFDADDELRLPHQNTPRDILCTHMRFNTDDDVALKPFSKMANIHQICSWLCKNPNILILAYNMYLLTQIPVANEFNFISPNTNSSTLATGVSHIPNQEDNVFPFTFFYFIYFLYTVLTVK